MNKTNYSTMKKASLLSFIFFIFTLNMYAQWFELNSGTSENLSDVCFIDENNGFVVGWNGIILKTIDGGEVWEQQNSTTTIDLNSVFFLSNNIGFVIGGNGYGPSFVILKTIDGGENWLNINDAINWQGEDVIFEAIGLHGISFENDNLHGCIVGRIEGGTALFIETYDGGVNWEFKNDIFWNNLDATLLNDVKFFDSTTGAAVGLGKSFFIYGNTGSQVEWTCLDEGVFGMSDELNSIAYVDSQTLFIAGQLGKIYKVSNGSWEEQNSNTTAWLTSISFVSPLIGYAVGQTMVRTFNGGVDWEVMDNIPISGQLESIYFVTANVGYAVGFNGTIIKTLNASVGINSVQTQDNISVIPNPFNTEVIIKIQDTNKQYKYSITNQDGRIFDCKELIYDNTSIKMGSYSSGVYYIKIEREDGYAKTLKMVKI